MHSFTPASEPVSESVHVALIAEDGSAIIHEEVPARDAPLRRTMLALQAELDAAGLGSSPQPVARKLYAGEDWPPAGQQLVKGKLVAVEPPA